MIDRDTNAEASGEAHERHLVTFALFAYNQEKYIREAVEGALAQTYSPLEIILSDDCSTDRTFEIMQELASNYLGPHEIVLNRNDKNLGLTTHVFAVAHLASGKLLIAAAGDDVSFPNRTSVIVENWLQTHCSAFTTDEEHYDDSGTYLGYFKRDMMANCTIEQFSSLQKSLGCTWAIGRDLLLKYQIPSRDVINEDVLLGLIAMLHNGVSYIPIATVKRTCGVGMSSNRCFPSKIKEKILFLTRRTALFTAMIEVFKINDRKHAIYLLEKELATINSLLDYAKSGKSLFKSIAYVTKGGYAKHIKEILKITLFRWMPFLK